MLSLTCLRDMSNWSFFLTTSPSASSSCCFRSSTRAWASLHSFLFLEQRISRDLNSFLPFSTPILQIIHKWNISKHLCAIKLVISKFKCDALDKNMNNQFLKQMIKISSNFFLSLNTTESIHKNNFKRKFVSLKLIKSGLLLIMEIFLHLLKLPLPLIVLFLLLFLIL